ncbi:MAG: FliM/FliN family flagellar motor switch protein [Alphaproteobacteria bacterium]
MEDKKKKKIVPKSKKKVTKKTNSLKNGEHKQKINENVSLEDLLNILSKKDQEQSISNLLSFDEDNTKGGILKQIIEKKDTHYKKLPVLEHIFDLLLVKLSHHLRNFISPGLEIFSENFSTMRLNKFLNTVQLPSIIGVINSPEWQNSGLCIIDGELTYSIINTLFGGQKGPIRSQKEIRPYTSLETGLMKKIINVILEDLQAVFSTNSNISFKLERIETNARFAMITNPTQIILIFKMHAAIGERTGNIYIAFPYSNFENDPVLLSKTYVGEKFRGDKNWETHLKNKLSSTYFSLKAQLKSETLSLNNILNWKVGTHVVFKSTPTTPVEIFCHNLLLFKGIMGQRSQNIAIKITDVFFNKGDKNEQNLIY